MSISAETQIIPVEGDDGKSYILYTIEVELFMPNRNPTSIRWSLQRRYSEFDSLLTRLKSQYAQQMLHHDFAAKIWWKGTIKGRAELVSRNTFKTW